MCTGVTVRSKFAERDLALAGRYFLVPNRLRLSLYDTCLFSS